MNKIFVGIFGIGIIAVILLASGCSIGTKNTIADDVMQKDNVDTSSGNVMMEKTNDLMMEQTNDAMMIKYSGKVLAGTTTPYIEFNKADYDAALADGKTILLEFYANWCPTCIAEQPDTLAAFNQLDLDNAVGFRVNYKDSNTDDDEVALAKEFGIAYQHTKVIIHNGVQVVKSPETWDAQRYITEMTAYS